MAGKPSFIVAKELRLTHILRSIFAAGFLALLFLGQALAHSPLDQATPEPGSRIAAAPTQISLRFGEAIEARFSGIELSRADGTKFATEAIVVRGNEMVAPVLEILASGTYKVDWHILSADGHRLKGSFKFEVIP